MGSDRDESKNRGSSSDESVEPSRNHKNRGSFVNEPEEPSKRHKHRHSSNNESEELSKRRKHRHRRHHSRKHEKHEHKREEEGEESGKKPPPMPVAGVVSCGKWRSDYDMEEGEIVEEDGADVEENEKKKADSDAESGEIKSETHEAVILPDHSPRLRLDDETSQIVTVCLRDEDLKDDGSITNAFVKRNTMHGTEMNHGTDLQTSLSKEHKMHENKSYESHKQLINQDTLNWAAGGMEKNKSFYDDDLEMRDWKKSSSTENHDNTHKQLASSPLHERNGEDVTSRSRSHERGRERSRSESNYHGASRLETHQEDTEYYTSGHYKGADDNRRMHKLTENHRHASRDLLREKERERSSSRSRHTPKVDRHHSGDTRERIRYGSRETLDRNRDRDRERDLKETGRDRTKNKERELERDRESSKDREWYRGRENARERGRERDRTRSRDRIDNERREWEQERERNRDREKESVDRDRERDLKETGRDRTKNKEQELERDRESSKDREWYRGRENARERRRERDRTRSRDRIDNERREWEQERERNRDREEESVGNSRNYKHYDTSDGHGGTGRDRSSDYKHRRLDEADYKDRLRETDLKKADSFKDAQSDIERKKLKRDEVDQETYQEKSDLQVEEEEEEDLNRIKEESRRRRQAILEKYRTQKLQQHQEPQLEDTINEKSEEPCIQMNKARDPPQHVAAAKAVLSTLRSPRECSYTNSTDTLFSVGKFAPQNGISASERTSGTGGLGEGTPKSERSNEDGISGESPTQVCKLNERSNDMFSDDIFGESPAGVRKSGKGDGLVIQRSGLQDNWDDAEGYYSYRFGEILDGRYEVIAAHGKGVFSTVVRAKDLKAGSGDPEEVAIKIIRNNDKMYKAGLEELIILKKLVGADMEDRRHCVRFLSSFKYRNHLCLVFESLHMNLREVLKKFGRNIGLKLTAVRTYAKQLFIALKHLRNCGVLHTDIKPDNMLVNDTKNVLKLCDFGNAMFAGKNEITPYLVSRFYRAPEIILGLPYDHPVDIWSVGCCLFELYSGKVLFPGSTNNDMLRLHMELKGPFPKKMLRKGLFTESHFDSDLNFFTIEEDPVTKKSIKKLVNMKPKDIGSIVLSSPGEDPKMLANFKDLLDKIFVLDPDKRMTVQQALGHPFITGK